MSAPVERSNADIREPAVTGQRVQTAKPVRTALSRARPPGVLDGGCPAGFADLGTPEREVLELLVVGGTDRAIAGALTAQPDEVSWYVRKLIKRVGHPTTRAGLVAIAVRHHLVDHPEPPHPGHLPDDAMALLWSMASGQTFKTFAKETGAWEAERIRANLRNRLSDNLPPEHPATLTPGHTMYLSWPALAEEAGWSPGDSDRL
ncbi:hypothetical protein ACIBCO_36830 [Streptomyces violascens]|uniref:hypothetical protein n=1 Tax=Streptomyces violascens TaxID=67381 RepID=UPI0037B75D55